MTQEMVLMLTEYLAQQYTAGDPEIVALLQENAVYMVPWVNPDGYVYNELTNPDGGGMWRKNRRDNGDGSFGVDLNRNYDYNWGYDDVGSSPVTSYSTYRGPSAFSEPETQAMRDFCNSRSFVIWLSYHSYSNLLLFPWSYAFTYTGEHELFLRLGEEMADGTGYFVGNTTEGTMPRSTSACDTNPNDECCLSCIQARLMRKPSWQ